MDTELVPLLFIFSAAVVCVCVENRMLICWSMHPFLFFKFLDMFVQKFAFPSNPSRLTHVPCPRRGNNNWSASLFTQKKKKTGRLLYWTWFSIGLICLVPITVGLNGIGPSALLRPTSFLAQKLEKAAKYSGARIWKRFLWFAPKKV